MITARTLYGTTARLSLPMLCIATSGCGVWSLRDDPPPPPPIAPITVAVAPAMNLSGSTDFEPLRVADLMASELTQLPGVRVIGVNRVLSVLNQEEQNRISSPEQAIQVAQQLGAEAILVFAITEYDPHDPPVVGMAAQLYASTRAFGGDGWDPVTASRSATPELIGHDPEGMLRPRAENQRVFNAADQRIAKDVLRFADERDADRSPFGPRLYFVSQEHFLRYCCQTTGRELLDRFRRIQSGAATARMESTG